MPLRADAALALRANHCGMEEDSSSCSAVGWGLLGHVVSARQAKLKDASLVSQNLIQERCRSPGATFVYNLLCWTVPLYRIGMLRETATLFIDACAEVSSCWPCLDKERRLIKTDESEQGDGATKFRMAQRREPSISKVPPRNTRSPMRASGRR